MRDLLNRNRLKVNKELASYDSRKYFSPSCYASSIVTLSVLSTHLHGKCIDIGCGDMPFRPLIERHVSQYDSIDIEKRVPDVKYLTDIQDMSMIDSSKIGTSMILRVLFHQHKPVFSSNFFTTQR